MANALFVWGTARALGGRVLLRLEDHDRGRCRPEYEAAILDDLEWLGLAPDAGEPASFRAGPSPYRQSDCGAEYEAALARLSLRAEVYHCDCSRKDIAAEAGGLDEEARYRGRCRRRGLAAAPGRGTRVRLEPGVERFLDLSLGDQAQDPAGQCGDLLLRDRLGNWTYQFSVVVDDLRHGIDLVIRGRDLLDSTGRQIRLARLLGRERPPVYLHHPLIHRADGAKLSKAGNDTGIRELRRAGIPPAAVLGQAAFLTGLLQRPTAVDSRDLAGLFSGRSFPA